ncbi:hypothetical protein BDZ88DRAFT_273743 [Geranomyces variabilis]|nr:hypothetical protein BDZ88DRAFT_273743 [Geranomyces variabilis]
MCMYARDQLFLPPAVSVVSRSLALCHYLFVSFDCCLCLYPPLVACSGAAEQQLPDGVSFSPPIARPSRTRISPHKTAKAASIFPGQCHAAARTYARAIICGVRIRRQETLILITQFSVSPFPPPKARKELRVLIRGYNGTATSAGRRPRPQHAALKLRPLIDFKSVKDIMKLANNTRQISQFVET